MGSDVVTCPAGISATTLADWRAGQLPHAEVERLRAHIAGCAICQAELTAYEAVARLLRQQREIEPGERIMAGVRQRAAQHAQRAHGGRAPVGSQATWSGLGALASVAALLLLAVHLFGADRPPVRGVTGQATATPTATATPVPTVGPGQFTPAVTAQDAWGSQGRVAQVSNTWLDATHRFSASSATPDGRELLGELATLGAGGNVLEAQAGLLDVATHQFTPVGPATQQPTPSFGGWSACVGGDDRYVVCEIQTPSMMNPGVNQRGPASLWSFDRMSGQVREITDLTHYTFPEFVTTNGLAQVEHGMVLFTNYGQGTTNGSTGIYAIDLTSNTITALRLPAQSPHAVDLSWPYLLYADTADPAQFGTLRVHDLATGQDVALPQVAALYAGIGAMDANHMPYFALADDTLFASVVTGRVATSNVPPNNVDGPDVATTLYAMDHIFMPGAHLRPVARYQGIAVGPESANARLVVFMFVAWDRATDRWVRYSTLSDGHGPRATLNGNALVLVGDGQLQTGEQVTIFDTTRLR